MKIVQLMGGLGNQMFQYAFGQGLAERYGETVLYDKSFLDNQTAQNDFYKRFSVAVRQYELSIFKNMEIRFADSQQVKKSVKNCFSNEIRKFLKFRFRLPIDYLHEYDLKIIEGATAVDGDGWPLSNSERNYYEGYWQNEKYFSGISGKIRNDFRFPEINDDFNVEIAGKISEYENSCFLHIRLGDYLSIGANLPVSYYQSAIEYMQSKVKDPYFFIFCEKDPSPVLDGLNLKKSFFIVPDTNAEQTACFRDMQLMSLCKHGILANSSFSWWAAWLGRSCGQIVTAPDPWKMASDIVCDKWVKIRYE